MTELQRLAYAETCSKHPTPFGLEWLEYKNKGGMYYVFGDDEIVIKGIFVFEKYRNKGVGHRLIGMLYDKVKMINEKEYGHIQRISINTNSNGQHLFNSIIAKGTYTELVAANIDYGNSYRRYHFIFDAKRRAAFIKAQKRKEAKDYFVSGFEKRMCTKTEYNGCFELVSGRKVIAPLSNKANIVSLFNGASLVKNYSNDELYIIKDGKILYQSKFFSRPKYDKISKLLSFTDYAENENIVNLAKILGE